MDTTRPQDRKVVKKEGEKQQRSITPGTTSAKPAGNTIPSAAATRTPAATRSPPSSGVTPRTAQALTTKPANIGNGHQPPTSSQTGLRSTPQSHTSSPARGSTKPQSEALIPVAPPPGTVSFGIGTLDRNHNTLHTSSGTVDAILAAARKKRELREAREAQNAKRGRLPILPKPATNS